MQLPYHATAHHPSQTTSTLIILTNPSPYCNINLMAGSYNIKLKATKHANVQIFSSELVHSVPFKLHYSR